MNKKNRTPLHDRLDAVIKKIGISRMQFSVKIGKSQSWAGAILNKNCSMAAEDLIKIKQSFGVNPLYILEGQKPEFIKS